MIDIEMNHSMCSNVNKVRADVERGINKKHFYNIGHATIAADCHKSRETDRSRIS